MSLLMAFEQGQIRTPYGDERSRTFTHKLEQELNRFGMQKNGKLESVGTHDDLAMALALANWGTKEFKGSIVSLDDYMPGFGVDKSWEILIHFHRRRLEEDQNMYVREGDFVLYNDNYYEIVKLVESRLLFGQADQEFEISATCKRARTGLFDAT